MDGSALNGSPHTMFVCKPRHRITSVRLSRQRSTPRRYLQSPSVLYIHGVLAFQRQAYNHRFFTFLRATAATAVARLSNRNSVCLSVTRVQARITKFSPSASWKTLASGSIKLFYKFYKAPIEGGRENLRLLGVR